MTVCMRSTPAERRGFLLVGIGDTGQPQARLRLVAIFKKLLLMLFAIFDVPSTLRLFNVVSTPHIDRQYLSPTKFTRFRLA
jgi:hypothetical protein